MKTISKKRNKPTAGSPRKRWTLRDFDKLSWHDCTVHAIRFNNPHSSESIMSFDLDFIQEWILADDGAYDFYVAPATLTFKNVSNVRISIGLDFNEPLQINTIKKSTITRDNMFMFTIEFHCIARRRSWIKFEASGFRQVVTKRPVRSCVQELDRE